MRLHQSSEVPDWEGIAPGKHNSWQQVAVRTHGVLTPGNLTSFVGLVLVIVGLGCVLAGNYWPGLAAIALGRLCDILDGMVADRTGTKSPLGEGVDAAFDKIGAFATLIVFAEVGIVPWLLALLIGLQNAANSSLGLVAKRHKLILHPSPVGKISTVGEWLALLLFALNTAQGVQFSPVAVLAFAIAVFSLLLGLYATWQYARALFRE